MANFKSPPYKNKRVAKKNRENDNETYPTEKLELYRAFMIGYVKRINEASFNVQIGGVRIGLAKYTRLAQINLNSRIITFSRYAIENVPERGRRYLVLHELAHVKEANHNKRFWQLVEKYEPDYHQIGKSLEVAFKKNVRDEEKGKTEANIARSPILTVTGNHIDTAAAHAPDSILYSSSDYNEEELWESVTQEEKFESGLYDCDLENFLDWTC